MVKYGFGASKCLGMMVSFVNFEQAKEIAMDFLEQHHSVIKAEKATLDNDGIWLVDVLVSEPQSRKFTVKINAKTGYIISWQ